MKDFSIYAVSIINLLILIRSCWLIYKQRIKPALAMWTFFSIAVAISLATYMSVGSYSLLDNILNTTDLVLVVSVAVAIFIYGDKSTRFNKFDMGCLIIVLIITAFWLITKNHLVTNLSIQTILVIAYFPVIKRFWESKENTESFTVWTGMLLAASLSLLSSKGMLATVYALRAIISILLLLSLMVRIEMRKKVV